MKSRSETLLRFYARFRNRKPTVFEALARQPLAYWLVTAALISFIAACYIYSGGEVALVLLAMAVGGFLRDLGWLLRFKRDWPTLNRVLNWQALEEELASNRSADA